jgi:hypothetical protein
MIQPPVEPGPIPALPEVGEYLVVERPGAARFEQVGHLGATGTHEISGKLRDRWDRSRRTPSRRRAEGLRLEGSRTRAELGGGKGLRGGWRQANSAISRLLSKLARDRGVYRVVADRHRDAGMLPFHPPRKIPGSGDTP